MNLTISGKQIDIGEALSGHVQRSLDAAVSKYFDGALEGTVTFSRHAHEFRVDISVHVGRNIMAQSHGLAADAYLAFDAACDHVAKRLRRHKRRLRDHNMRSVRQTEETLARQSVLAVEQETADDAAGHDSVVVAEMQTRLQTLTVGEAVMRLDLEQLPALMFRNSANGLLNMVYRRTDGNIGWVDPQNAPPAATPS
ncbi:MAG: ribosome-associated translation inhibitor RaiA [Alphaproteobacteria bacterium]|nr:ribosome-associated translation inhibitor RaiA [Alphaproteobacteria bacterium]